MKHIIIFVALLIPILSISQSKARLSPLSVVTSRYQDTYIKITYSQPNKKGREIFGELVPFGKVWRTGANEATEITLTGNIMIGEKLLKQGTYSLFTIPNKNQWTIIFNADVGLWGSYNYNSEKDVIRFDVPRQSASSIYEAFTIKIEEKNNLADITIMWDDTKISFPIQYLESIPKP